MATFTDVGAHEAKTHLSDFLRQVRSGALIRITQRGEHIADLIPPGVMARQHTAEAVEQMWKFMHSQRIVVNADIISLISEGRD